MNRLSYVWVLVSILGCAYQVIILTTDYMKYEVVSSVSFTFPEMFELPSVTWCIPLFQIMNWTLVREMKSCDRIFRVSIYPNATCMNFTERHFSKHLLLRDANVVYNNILNNFLPDQIFNKTLAANSLIFFFGRNSLSVTDIYSAHELNDVYHVEEYLMAASKCFRMRHRSDQRWMPAKNLTVGTQNANLIAVFQFHDRLKSYSDRLLVAIGGNEDHSVSYSSDVFITMSTFVTAFLTYDVHVSHLLPRPYRTECFDYIKHSGFDSQKHCFETCLTNKTKKAFGRKLYSLKVRRGEMEMTTNFSFRGGNGLFHTPGGDVMRKSIAKLSESCDSKCQQVDCYRKLFATRLISSLSVAETKEETYHSYYAPSNPESTISTSVKFPLIEYLVVTASCFGFWFGFSVLSMASMPQDMLHKIKFRMMTGNRRHQRHTISRNYAGRH